MKRQTDLRWWGFTVGSMACAVYCLVAARKVWPPMDGDATAYFPPAIEWSEGREFTNPVWLAPLNDTIDGPGGRRYIYHGFLYSWMVGTLAKNVGGGPEACVTFAYLIHWCAAVAAGAGVLFWLEGQSRWGVGLGVLAPLSMLAISVAWHGRMEPLALLLVGAAASAWKLLPRRAAAAAAGFAAAALGFTSPACGVLAVTLLPAVFLLSRKPLPAGSTAAACLGFASASLLAILLYPFPISDWVGGVLRHSRINLSLSVGQGFLQAWILSPQLPLLALSLLSLGLASLVVFARCVGGVQAWWRLAAWSAVALFAVGLARIALVKTEASYNAVVWFPLLAAVGVAGSGAGWRVGIVSVALILPTVGLARSAVILERQPINGPGSYYTAREVISHYNSQGLAVAPGLFLACPDLHHVLFTHSPANGMGKTWWIDQQVNTGHSSPSFYTGYELKDSTFGPALRLGGIPISRTPNGWQFALYRRSEIRE